MNKDEELFSLTQTIEKPYIRESSNLNFGTNVNKCLFKMYDYLLTEDQIEKEAGYLEFIKSYEELDNRDKEIIKKDWLDITQSENKKVKRKGDR